MQNKSFLIDHPNRSSPIIEENNGFNDKAVKEVMIKNL